MLSAVPNWLGAAWSKRTTEEEWPRQGQCQLRLEYLKNHNFWNFSLIYGYLLLLMTEEIVSGEGWIHSSFWQVVLLWKCSNFDLLLLSSLLLNPFLSFTQFSRSDFLCPNHFYLWCKPLSSCIQLIFLQIYCQVFYLSVIVIQISLSLSHSSVLR